MKQDCNKVYEQHVNEANEACLSRTAVREQTKQNTLTRNIKKTHIIRNGSVQIISWQRKTQLLMTHLVADEFQEFFVSVGPGLDEEISKTSSRDDVESKTINVNKSVFI